MDAATDDRGGALRSQVATAGLYTASSYVATALGPLKGFVLAALFAPNEFSAFIALTTALGWFAYVDLGIFDGQNRRIPTLRGAGRTEESRHVAAVAQGATYILALVAVLIAAAVAALQAAGALGGSWEFTAALGAAVLAQQVAGFPNSLCYAEKRFRLQGSVRAATAVIDFALGVGAALIFGIAGVIVAVIVATVFEAVFFHVGFRTRLVPAFDLRMSVDLARTGLPIQAIWFAQTNLVAVDKVVALAWLGREELALYALAGATASLGTLIPSTISSMFAPSIYERIGAGRDVLPRVGLALDVTTALCVTVIPISIVCLPEATYRLLPRYDPAVSAAQLLVVATALLAASGGLTPYLIGTGRAARVAGLVILNAATNLVLDIGIVRAGFGITGIAAGSLISYAWLAIALHAWVVPAGARLRRVAGTLVPVCAAAAIGAAASLAIGREAPGIVETLVAATLATAAAAPIAVVVARRARVAHASNP